LYREPIDADLAQFVGEAVLLPGLAAGGVATCALGRLPLARATPDGPIEVMVRPEQIKIEPRAHAGAARGRVLALTYFGPDASVLVSLEAGARIVTARISGHKAPQTGAEAWLSVEGPAMAYPSVPRLVEAKASSPFAGPQSPSIPQGASARTIKESQL
jgi:iron(III) transport system ATP-binding protein